MRITKKTLREAKSGLRHRMNELSSMVDGASYETILQEHKRVFPYQDDGLRPGLVRGLMMDLLHAALDRAIPDAWTD